MTNPVDSLINSLGGLTSLLPLFDMRDTIYELKYYAEFNVRYWGIIENKYSRVNNGIKILLAIGSIIGLVTLIGGKDSMLISSLISALCALIATAVIPVIGWEHQISKISETKNRWIDLEKIINGYWRDYERTEKLSRSKLGEVESIMADLSKTSFWIKEDCKIKDRVELDMKAYYPVS